LAGHFILHSVGMTKNPGDFHILKNPVFRYHKPQTSIHYAGFIKVVITYCFRYTKFTIPDDAPAYEPPKRLKKNVVKIKSLKDDVRDKVMNRMTQLVDKMIHPEKEIRSRALERHKTLTESTRTCLPMSMGISKTTLKFLAEKQPCF
jgi:hypothetical protein